MTPPVPTGLAGIIKTFGDPRKYVNYPGRVGVGEDSLRALPIPLTYAGDPEGIPLRRIRAHELLVDELIAALVECRQKGVLPKRMKFGGCYAWRLKRGSGSISCHTWGIAVDIEPVENGMGRKWKKGPTTLDVRIIDVFTDRGWTWGNDWSRPDPMHFQWAKGY